MEKREESRLFIVLCVIGLIIVLLLIIGIPSRISGEAEQTMITLKQDAVTISGAGASVRGNTVMITRGGRYLITGTLEDGQIYVDAGNNEQVELTLGGADISAMTDAAIYIENAGRTTILLAEGTRNRIQSGMAPDSGEVKKDDTEKTGGAALYAKDDLSITGTGFLQVFGYINNGIHTKNNLLIEGGNIEVVAVQHGIKGNDSVTITGGELAIAVGKKGVQSELEMRITGGKLQIIRSEEGLESNQITIEGGTVTITASDDGINANGGAAKKDKEPSADVVGEMPNLIIRGGKVNINAEGDGVDSNGNLFIEGGTVTIDGPTGNGDGPLDYGSENGGSCTISGGEILAIGSAGMAETFDGSSAQCSFCHIFDYPYEAGSEIVISDAGGNVLCHHTAAKKGASVVFSSPALVMGETYSLRVGGRTVEIVIDAVSTISGRKVR